MAGAEASQTDDELIVIKNLVQKVKKEKAEAADKAQVGIDRQIQNGTLDLAYYDKNI